MQKRQAVTDQADQDRQVRNDYRRLVRNLRRASRKGNIQANERLLEVLGQAKAAGVQVTGTPSADQARRAAKEKLSQDVAVSSSTRKATSEIAGARPSASSASAEEVEPAPEEIAEEEAIEKPAVRAGSAKPTPAQKSLPGEATAESPQEAAQPGDEVTGVAPATPPPVREPVSGQTQASATEETPEPAVQAGSEEISSVAPPRQELVQQVQNAAEKPTPSQRFFKETGISDERGPLLQTRSGEFVPKSEAEKDPFAGQILGRFRSPTPGGITFNGQQQIRTPEGQYVPLRSPKGVMQQERDRLDAVAARITRATAPGIPVSDLLAKIKAFTPSAEILTPEQVAQRSLENVMKVNPSLRKTLLGTATAAGETEPERFRLPDNAFDEEGMTTVGPPDVRPAFRLPDNAFDEEGMTTVGPPSSGTPASAPTVAGWKANLAGLAGDAALLGQNVQGTSAQLNEGLQEEWRKFRAFYRPRFPFLPPTRKSY